MSLHSSKVINAILTGLSAALTGVAQVSEEESRQIDLDTGAVIIRRGEAGEPDVILSPRSYAYEHLIPLEIVAPSRAEVDRILGLIGDWIDANRSLGGLCDWLDSDAPKTDVAEQFGTDTYPYALVDLAASYTTPSPLS